MAAAEGSILSNCSSLRRASQPCARKKRAGRTMEISLVPEEKVPLWSLLLSADSRGREQRAGVADRAQLQSTHPKRVRREVVWRSKSRQREWRRLPGVPRLARPKSSKADLLFSGPYGVTFPWQGDPSHSVGVMSTTHDH